MSEIYQTEDNMQDILINAYKGVKECNLALYKLADTYKGLCAKL